MNAVDILFILLLLGGLAIGFFHGTIRLAISIVALYVSIVLASLYFQVVGNFFRTRMGTSLEAGQVVAFAMIMLVSFLLLTIAGLYTFRYARIPAGLDFIDRIIGLLLGLVLSGLLLGMLALILKDLFIDMNTARSLNFPITQWFQGSARTSLLLRFFAGNILPLIYATLQPFLPAESALIFRL